MTLRDIQWNPVYESSFSGESLTDSFYRPFLREATEYDRLAGYLSLRGLAHALEGIDSLLETDGTVRIIAGTDLSKPDRQLLFPDVNAPLPPRQESQLAIIGHLLTEDRLQIKVAEPVSGGGLFHPKLGIATDSDRNRVTFEGSANETSSAWRRNYERFKVHRSWVDAEARYTREDVATFEQLWADNHPAVDVHPLNEATATELVEWTPTDESTLDDHVQQVRVHPAEGTLPEPAVANVLSTAGRAPGGLHLAEDVSPISPWPHQRVISDTAVSIYPNNLLLCDEVGLGKTIEAGLTLSRLIYTGRIQKALLLVPAGLTQQWQEELHDKFNLHAFIHDRRQGRDYLIDPDDQAHALSGRRDADTWDGTPLGGFITNRDQPTVTIVSWHTARREDNLGLTTPHPDTTPSDTVWDATIVDEAHSARRGTQLYDLLTRANAASSAMYALTATPMQLNVGELYDLLRLCNLPAEWDDKRRFERFFETRSALADALAATNPSGVHDTAADERTHLISHIAESRELDPDTVRDRLAEFAELVHAHITSYPGYDDQVDAVVSDADLTLAEQRTTEKLVGTATTTTFDEPRDLLFECAPETWRVLADVSQWATPVHTRVSRNTRAVLRACQDLGLPTGTIPRRDVDTVRIPLGPVEDLHQRIRSYTEDIYKRSQQELTGRERLAHGFVMTTYRQRLTSSLHAARESLLKRYTTLQERLHEDESLATGDLADEMARLAKDPGDVPEATLNAVLSDDYNRYTPESTVGRSIVEAELAELANFIGQLRQIPTDPKLEQLKSDIKDLRRDARDNIIIFTQYEDTVHSIRGELAKTHPHVGTYTGGGGTRYDDETGEWTSVSKEVIKRKFLNPDADTNILVCTDAASEGLNLQTGDALINYDLPWNPMRVEQRIGRIDRIGQRNPVVKVINYSYADSIEGDIYETLEERLAVFEDVVGTMRPVLSGLESDIETAVMRGDESGAGIDANLADTAEQRNKQAREAAGRTDMTHDLDAIETEDDLIEATRLDGWADDAHPALDRIGSDDRAHNPVDLPTLAHILLTGSDALDEAGWEFTALRRDVDAADFPGTDDDAYLLQPPADAPHWVRQAANGGPETAQTTLGDDDALAVTFDPDTADDYPSLRLLLPNDPLYDHLLEAIRDATGGQRGPLILVHAGIVNGEVITWSDDAESPEGLQPLVTLPAVQANSNAESSPELPTGETLPSKHEATGLVETWCSTLPEPYR